MSKYKHKGSKQNSHNDKTSKDKITQVIDVSLGPVRYLDIEQPKSGYRTHIPLEQGKIYVLTHFFNKHFKHSYIHTSNKIVSISLTYRNEE